MGGRLRWESAMTEAFLGVDAGTSGIKVCAFTREGRLVAKAHRAVPVVTPYPLWAEIDLDRYWAATADAIREVATRVPTISSIGLATTCPTTILLDEEGQAIRPGILYLDGRAQAGLENVVGADAEAEVQQTGNRASTSTCWAANLALVARMNRVLGQKCGGLLCLTVSWSVAKWPGRHRADPSVYWGLMRIADPEPSRGVCDLLARWGISLLGLSCQKSVAVPI